MKHDADVRAAIEALAIEYVARFPETIHRPRIVGREAEYPVIMENGQAADVRQLWAPLMAEGDLKPKYDTGNQKLMVALEGDDYSYALEVGLGTVEINSRPCSNLYTVQRIMEHAVSRLVRAAARYGWQVIAYGIQPMTTPALSLMSPKQRYQSLYRAMGSEWLWYTVTASDQLHIDISAAEMVKMLNFGNLITPVIIALCANSPVYGGQLSPFCSGREGRMAQIQASEHRHGIPDRPYDSIRDYVDRVSQSTFLILQYESEVLPSSQQFTEYLREHGADFDAFLFHEHYVWNSARLRTSFGTIEIRPACQQPWSEEMAAAALTLGLIEAAEPITAYVQEVLGAAYWERMRIYHQQVVRRGLAAPQPAPAFLQTIVQRAEQGLHERGLDEERLLEPIWGRLHHHANPAQRVRRIFRSDGLHGVLAHATIRPGFTRPATI